MKTRIGNKLVKVRMNGGHAAVHFSGGQNFGQSKGEGGNFYFWTAVLPSGERRRIWGRAKTRFSPGERFHRMGKEMKSAKDKEDRKIYEKYFNLCLKAKYVRPSTRKEIIRWMETHSQDSGFADRVTIGKRVFKVKAAFNLVKP